MILLSQLSQKKKKKEKKGKERKRKEKKNGGKKERAESFSKSAVKDPRPRRYRQFTLTRRYMGMPRRIDRATIPCGGLMFIHDTAKWIMKYDYT